MPICAWYASTKQDTRCKKQFLFGERSAFRFAAYNLYSSILAQWEQSGNPRLDAVQVALPRG